MSQIFPVRFVPMDLRDSAARYLACYRDAWRAAHGSLAGFDEKACLMGAAARAERYPGSLLEVRWEDRFAGVLAMDDGRRKDTGWIAFCYVAEEYRRRGIGRAMIEKARERTSAQGRLALRLTVAPKNPALGFYERLGFRCVGTEPGALEDLYVMESEL